MKATSGAICIAVIVVAESGLTQGTLIYDQQSSTDETAPFPQSGATIQQLASPYGQSFTPSTNLINFIRLKLNDNSPLNSIGAILHVNLRGGSIGGSVISSTDPVLLPNGYAGTVNFFFSSAV